MWKAKASVSLILIRRNKNYTGGNPGIVMDCYEFVILI